MARIRSMAPIVSSRRFWYLQRGYCGKTATFQVPGHEQGLDSPPWPGKPEPAVPPSLLLFKLVCWRQVGALQGGCKATQAPREYYGEKIPNPALGV